MGILANCRPEWIFEVSGIEERHYAHESETVASMALRAAQDCLERAGLPPAAVGMMIVASGSMERCFPGPAATVASRLGLGEVPAIDLPMASAGSLVAMALAAHLAPVYGTILVIGAEKMSTIALRIPREPGVAVLFGDGAGACLIDADEGLAKILDSDIHSDGVFAEDLHLTFDSPIKMDGRSVILQAARKLPRAILTVLERNNLCPQDIDVFLMHQANQNLTNRVAQEIAVPSERFYSNIRHCGNTSSASMLIAAAEWNRSQNFRPGGPVVFAAFGAGFHWGALLATGV
jgi:3-oxoacyl-[acyl-carrier-protein] synthase-3